MVSKCYNKNGKTSVLFLGFGVMKPKDQKHSQPITVRVKPGMKAALVEISKQTGKPVTELIRNSIHTIAIPKDGMKKRETG